LLLEIKNGICIENMEEHIYGVHNHNPFTAKRYSDNIIEHIGKDTWDWLETLRADNSKPDLKIIKIYLEEELKKLK
jgi:hypothetical protein